MKKLTIFAALCALVLGSCAENSLDGVTPENNITLPDLTAGFAEDETKTYVHNNTYLRWHEADLITAFYGNTLNRQYKFKGKTGDNSGTFSLVPSGELGTGNALEAIYAIYPYDGDATITDKGEISLSLPATQYYAENSFGRGANTMIAVTENVEDTFLGFKNACGYLKLKLYNESGARLKSVEVRGNNSEKIAGSATATIEFGGVPTVTMLADATTSVTLDCGEGIALGTTSETATELWVVLPEVTFEGGITITATDTEGITFEKSTTKPVAITRNDIQPMAALEAEFTPAGPANNEIWYTATEKVTPYVTDVFGANIVSNEWDETTGEGVITFDREVASIGWNAFYNCSKLTSIIIPEGVISIGWNAFSNCSSLVSITIPDSVTSVAYSAFNGCSSLPIENNIKYAGTCIVEVTEKTQTTYTIKEGTKFIGPEAFYNCSNLTNIVIPDIVISIGYYAFAGCFNLTSIIIPNSVTSLGESAFADCSRIEYLTIGNGITRIEPTTFYGCSSITSITIPDSVTSIQWSAFNNCSSLAEVYCKSTTPPSGDDCMFNNNASGRKIYVPRESVEAYKSADYWSEYADDIVGYDF